MAYEKVDKSKLKNAKLDIDPAVAAAVEAEQNIESKLEELNTLQKALADDDFPLAQRWEGHKPLSDATPGDMAFDPTYIPEYLELTNGSTRRISKHVVIRGQLHILTADGQKVFWWSSKRKIPTRKHLGFRFARWSDLIEGSYGFFEKGEGDTIWNGDGVLMEISLDGLRRMHEREEKLKSDLEGSAGEDFFRHAEQAHVPSFKDDLKRGVREMMT